MLWSGLSRGESDRRGPRRVTGGKEKETGGGQEKYGKGESGGVLESDGGDVNNG